jgi:hypothetical protein
MWRTPSASTAYSIAAPVACGAPPYGGTMAPDVAHLEQVARLGAKQQVGHDARIRAADEQRVGILPALDERAEFRREVLEMPGLETAQAGAGVLDVLAIGHGSESAGRPVLSIAPRFDYGASFVATPSSSAGSPAMNAIDVHGVRMIVSISRSACAGSSQPR